jgi:hypothetical protein
MADVAAHLVDRVFPIVPVRQWVLSLPFALRYRMAYDARLTGDVLNVFIRALFGELRRRASELLRVGASQCGAVTFVQRWGKVHRHLPPKMCLRQTRCGRIISQLGSRHIGPKSPTRCLW